MNDEELKKIEEVSDILGKLDLEIKKAARKLSKDNKEIEAIIHKGIISILNDSLILQYIKGKNE